MRFHCLGNSKCRSYRFSSIQNIANTIKISICSQTARLFPLVCLTLTQLICKSVISPYLTQFLCRTPYKLSLANTQTFRWIAQMNRNLTYSPSNKISTSNTDKSHYLIISPLPAICCMKVGEYSISATTLFQKL